MNKKVKELFEEWYMTILSNSDNPYSVYHWDNIPASLQWGVMQDFYDSQGLHVLLTYEYNYGFVIMEGFDEVDGAINWYDTIQEAREAALIKANEILKDRL